MLATSIWTRVMHRAHVQLTGHAMTINTPLQYSPGLRSRLQGFYGHQNHLPLNQILTGGTRVIMKSVICKKISQTAEHEH